MSYEYRHVMEHIEVYDSNGKFVVSADTLKEAQNEVEQLESQEV